ncbi:zinc ABC transporter substrate-binding protein AztC [Leucobacter sp. NPDC058333]|uniref:zinc ABC transporter substrate-binding protein AztC n=1 Tax=Leucobacter sp. NPDC058333 TaxID=3346450 RepID=UPI003648ECA0
MQIRDVRRTASRTGTALAVAAALAMTTALAGCSVGTSTTGDSGRPRIVVTTNILGDVVDNVLGDQADVTTLMRPNADPHSFEISAKEAALLGEADLVVSSGLGLEEGLQQHLDRAADAGAPVLVAGDEVTALPYTSGEAEGAPDPHFWTDPRTMLDVVDAIEREATSIDDIDAQQLADDADAYRDELRELDADMAGAFGAIPKSHRALVTNHHVFGYLADRFDFRIIGAAVPSGTTLAAPSAADLRELSDAITEAGVTTIFAESSQPDRLVQVLASEAEIDVRVEELFTESLSAPGGEADTYLALMRANTERITNGLTQ